MTDPATLRFNQLCIVTLSTLALAARMPWLVGGLALVLLLGSARPELALFKQLWERLVRPTLGLKASPVDDDPRAHVFAQTIGGTVLALAFLAFLVGQNVLGAALTILVIALALLNLTTNICVGCLLYFQYRMLRHRLTTARR